jgi:host factor-I protein
MILDIKKYKSLENRFYPPREPAMGNNVEIDRNADDQAAAIVDGSKAEMKASGPPQFIPDISSGPINIRMKDGRPIKGVHEAHNLYQLLLDLGHGKKMIVFKGAISSIEYEIKPKKAKPVVQKW